AVRPAGDPAVERSLADDCPGGRIDGEEGGRLARVGAVLLSREPRRDGVEALLVRPERGADQSVAAGVDEAEAAHRAGVDQHERGRDLVVGEDELRSVGREAPGGGPAADRDRATRTSTE